jgi:8-oxo-dGTP pyrophosphatase MutT (NUDIX family)
VTETTRPKHAASVIPLRTSPSGDVEVLLTQRSAELGFLGGMYCFPGGILDRDDYSAVALQRCHGLTPGQARAVLGAHLTPERALGIWICAVRELFEEVGILLAVNETREPVQMTSDLHRRLADKHQKLLENSLSFTEVLATEMLRSDLSRLQCFSHWQTPAQFPVRFDTRFFIADVTDQQLTLGNSAEVTDTAWLSPDRALEMFDEGRLPMIFPTFAALRALADFESLSSIVAEFKTRRIGPAT